MAQMKTTDQLRDIYKLPLPWEKLNGSKILIAGASGLIGSSLVKALVLNPLINYTVYALGRDLIKLEEIFSDYRKFNLVLLEGDVSKKLNLKEKFDYIIDCASNANPASFSRCPVETILGNICGVNNLLAYGVQNKLQRFLYVSSGEVYGEGGRNPFIEEHSSYINNLNPRACYPISKRAAENLCIAYAQEYKADVVIARPCHIYGPNFLKTDDRAYAQFFRKARNGEDIVLKSAGLLNRSWCYVRDCVSALLFILLKGASNEAYNISDTPMTIKDFAEAIALESRVKVVYDIPDESITRPIISKGILDSSKLRRLGWYPLDKLQSNINASLEDLR